MNLFEQELRKLFEDGSVIQTPWFSGNDCRGTLDTDLRVRVQFACSHVSGNYDTLKLAVLNRTGGEVDHVMLCVEDVWIPKDKSAWSVCGPYMNYSYQSHNYEWQFHKPTSADYDALRKAATGYLNVYRRQVMDREQTLPPVLPRSSAAHPPRKTGYER